MADPTILVVEADTATIVSETVDSLAIVSDPPHILQVDEQPPSQLVVDDNQSTLVDDEPVFQIIEVAEQGPVGPIGPQGPRGTPGAIVSSGSLILTQDIPDTVWDFTHSLGKYPSVDVYDSSNRQVEAEVVQLAIDHFQVHHAFPFSGYVVLN